MLYRNRKNRFGQCHEVGLIFIALPLHQRKMSFERARDSVRLEFQILRHVRLHQPHADRCAHRRCPRLRAAEPPAADHHDEDQRDPTVAARTTLPLAQHQQAQASREQRCGERDAVHAERRRPP